MTAIGSAPTHMEVLEMPDRISKGVLDRGLDANTAFETVPIDIAAVDVGENIGARLQTDQADADLRMAVARAEVRRAEAVARRQEMKAKVAARFLPQRPRGGLDKHGCLAKVNDFFSTRLFSRRSNGHEKRN